MMTDRMGQIERSLSARGVRWTAQRSFILRRALAHLHFTAEGLVADVRAKDSTIARGTVYRTLTLLHQNAVLEKHDFRYGPPYYEVTFGKAHHDHLMCVRCGEVIEFQEPRVEVLQQAVVKRYGYELLSHAHKLYGFCARCRTRRAKAAAKPNGLRVAEVVE